MYAKCTHTHREVMKTNKSSIWCKAVSHKQANKHAALISSAIRHPWCVLHGRGSVYCGSLITLQKKPLPTLTHKCGRAPFLSVTVDNCSFSDHLNEYFTDSVPIYMMTSPTQNSFRGVSCGSQELCIFCSVFWYLLERMGKFLAFQAVLTPWHIRSKALKLQLQ